MQITIRVQSRADLAGRYGPDGMAKILNNSAAIVLFGGTADDQELTAWSRLAGERDEVVETRNAQGQVTSRTVRKVPVLAPSQIAGLPEFRAVLFIDGMPPAVGRAPKAWKRRDVRAAAAAITPAVPVQPSASTSVLDIDAELADLTASTHTATSADTTHEPTPARAPGRTR